MNWLKQSLLVAGSLLSIGTTLMADPLPSPLSCAQSTVNAAAECSSSSYADSLNCNPKTISDCKYDQQFWFGGDSSVLICPKDWLVATVSTYQEPEGKGGYSSERDGFAYYVSGDQSYEYVCEPRSGAPTSQVCPGGSVWDEATKVCMYKYAIQACPPGSRLVQSADHADCRTAAGVNIPVDDAASCLCPVGTHWEASAETHEGRCQSGASWSTSDDDPCAGSFCTAVSPGGDIPVQDHSSGRTTYCGCDGKEYSVSGLNQGHFDPRVRTYTHGACAIARH